MTNKIYYIILCISMNNWKLKDDHSLSNCCSPTPDDVICGYYSHDNIIKIHKKNCQNLKNVDPERLLSLNWSDIFINYDLFSPDNDYKSLDSIDFLILKHHTNYGIDYSLVIARKLQLSKQEAFDHHKKLRDFNLIERVEPKIVQYRKGIVNNKWIKHRNHTYYDITEKGKNYLEFYLSKK